MKRRTGILSVFILAFLHMMVGTVQAGLIDNGNGTVTQIRSDGTKLMWVQDGGLAGAASNWWEAMEWADNLDYAGYSNWRLPSTDDRTLGYSCTGSEMGYLYYIELGNPAKGPFINQGPFSNLNHLFWSSTEQLEDGAYVFWFNWDGYSGYQNTEYKEPSALSSMVWPWAVRTVPEPATLLLVGLGGLTLLRKREKINR